MFSEYLLRARDHSEYLTVIYFPQALGTVIILVSLVKMLRVMNLRSYS